VNLPSQKIITIQEFHHIREQSEQVMEYIDGVVFMAPSPSIAHQRISGRLHAQLFNLLEGTECEVFHAPFDIELIKEGEEVRNYLDLKLI
jgi:Uma2 family endonuclease